MNTFYLLDILTEKQYLNKDLLNEIERYTSSFNGIPVSKFIRENEVDPLINLIKRTRSYDDFHKGRVLSYLYKLKSRTVTLIKEQSKTKRLSLFNLLKAVLEKKHVGIVSNYLKNEDLAGLDKLFNKFDISPEELQSELCNSDSEEQVNSIIDSLNSELTNELKLLSEKIFIYESSDSQYSELTQFNSTLDSTDSHSVNSDSRYILDMDIYRIYTNKQPPVRNISPNFNEFTEKMGKLLKLLSHLITYRSSDKIVFSSSFFLSKLTQLLIHISKSKNEDDWIPISKVFLDLNGLSTLSECSSVTKTSSSINSSLYVLRDIGLVDIRKYDSEKGLSRRVKLTNLGLAITGILSVDIKRTRMKVAEVIPGLITEEIQDWKYYNGEFTPNTVFLTRVLGTISDMKYNVPSYIKKMKALNPILDKTNEEYSDFVLDNLEQIEEGVLPIDIKSVSNFHRDVDLLTTGHYIKKDKNGNYQQRQSFTVSSTGRMFSSYGYQGATKVSKSVIHEGKFNYDIPNSQIGVLVQELEKVKTRFWDEFDETEKQDCEEGLKHLIEYRDGDLKKEDIARSLRISVDDWKKCLYTLVFGGPLSSHPETSIGSIISKYVFTPGFKQNKLYKELDKFKRPINIWLKYCQKYYMEYELSPEQEVELRSSVNAIGGDSDSIRFEDYCYNGIVFLNKYSSIFADSKKLSSFILQGIESSFIFHLSIALADVNIEVISYEFDGIVTSKPIPEKYINYAREKSGFTTGQVLVKDFTKSLED